MGQDTWKKPTRFARVPAIFTGAGRLRPLRSVSTDRPNPLPGAEWQQARLESLQVLQTDFLLADLCVALLLCDRIRQPDCR